MSCHHTARRSVSILPERYEYISGTPYIHSSEPHCSPPAQCYHDQPHCFHNNGQSVLTPRQNEKHISEDPISQNLRPYIRESESSSKPLNAPSTDCKMHHRYLPLSHAGDNPVQHVDINTKSTDFTARSSSDPVLTAFAQLGALRLNAQRVLISLFGRHQQYILTESTRTLSLQDDKDHSSPDELWVGECTMSYDRSFCHPFLRSPKKTSSPTDRVLIVPDLTKDEEYQNHPDVTSYPNARSMAYSPIISPKGAVIGVYAVLDDKPRESLDPTLVKFLTDMATTVMNYLDATRSKVQHHRAERMVVGIGSFLEGKGSLRNSWLDATGHLDHLDVYNHDVEGNINEKQQEKQVSDTVNEAKNGGRGSSTQNRSMPFRQKNSHKRESNATIGRPLRPLESLPETDISINTSPAPILLSKKEQVGNAFSRGANLVRESMEVEAAIFFDANFSSRGTFSPTDKSDTESSSGRDSISSASGDERKLRGPTTEQNFCSTANAEDSGSGTIKPCEILGFATSGMSSINDELTNDRRIAVSEPFLASLLHRYPQGKIFNFSSDGSISESETNNDNFKSFIPGRGDKGGKRRGRSRKHRKQRRMVLRQDAETLLQLAPDARSIIFSPLWDSHLGRWHSAALSWTQSPRRVFTSNDELAFMFAFGNTIMAEIHRLEAEFAEKAKASVLAGLSHELRSPLHGIFGMADLLDTNVMNTLQRGFVHTISSCAFTLLGSINQLLEYAQIKDLQSTSASAQYPGGPSQDKLLKSGESLADGQPEENSHIQLDVIIEEAVETVFSGYSFFNGLQFPLNATRDNSFFGAGRFDVPGGVQVIVDIESPLGWKFSTKPGAWHVILTNVVGNALKFTERGYVHVSLKSSPIVLGDVQEATSSNISMSVKDTGCGMSPEFLRNGLFRAFSQEEGTTVGNGLGLNITQRIVLSLGGTIEIDSHQGVGTEVRISVDLNHIPGNSLESPETSTISFLKATEAFVGTKTIGLLGLDSSESALILTSSLRHLCEKWFGMNVVPVLLSQSEFAHCDFYISPFDYYHDHNLDVESIISSHAEQFSSPVIVICPSPRMAQSMYVTSQDKRGTDIVEFISQPCGPRKLAKTFEICSKRYTSRVSSADEPNHGAAGVLDKSSIHLGSSEAQHQLPPEALDPIFSRAQMIEGFASTDHPRSHVPPKHLELQDDSHNSMVSPTTNPAAHGDSALSNLEQDNDSPQPESHHRTEVLIVDDNDINVKILSEYMKKLGCDHKTSSNGLEALESYKANASSIGLIIMDISMPVMDGLESARHIRTFEMKSNITPPVKIVALTGVAQDDLQRDTLRSGMDAFMTKPARMKNLIPLIEESGIAIRNSE
ncbi:unnamed protein product [Penicillium salamii]|uniref:CheY-like superfamily n=1 Tax=Penicillium salamii TaxID=1612424 RepID=A0A9W4JFM6_9EURO|nr:unnamed protein product [Penicillium salamii]